MGAPLRSTTVLVLSAVVDASSARVWATRVPVVVQRERDRGQEATEDRAERLRGVTRTESALVGEVR